MRCFGSIKTTAALAGKGSSMNHIDTRKSTVNTKRKFGSDQKARQTSPFMGRKESADSEAVPWVVMV